MAFPRFKPLGSFLFVCKPPYRNSQCEAPGLGRNCPVVLSQKCHPRRLFLSGVPKQCTAIEKSDQNFEESVVALPSAVTDEIKLYQDYRNRSTQTCFSDTRQPYGPPLAILLPWTGIDENLMKKLIELYWEKGFDVVTVNLTKEQFLYPCVAGNAMNVVTELLEYLNGVHKHRPYVFHGFSVGIYLYGEILAQFADHYETYRTITNNVKGCLWDSPVDVLTVRQNAGKFFHPNNWLKRFFFNKTVRRHFKKHYYDSVVYWLRARENFCNPIIKVPNVFFMSYTDPLSNPCSVQSLQKTLQCNGVPIFQKTWWDSEHSRHYEKYCYEYMYGMILFLHLANFFPDECGRYQNSLSTASLANLRLSKTARDNLC